MPETLIEAVMAANRSLPGHGLATLTWGNASGADRHTETVVIKGSGISYADLTKRDMVAVNLDGRTVSGGRRPSTDTPTHLSLYRAYPQIGGVVHTHSPWATAWAQAERDIPLLGTTHADLCQHPIPVTRALTAEEIVAGYEEATGEALVETIAPLGPDELPCALVRGHGAFAWGPTPALAVQHAVMLEEIARTALLTTVLAPQASGLDEALRRKHFERKHGPDAYYGQE